ncbi:hypothetical protein [Metabacillus endolithicus]
MNDKSVEGRASGVVHRAMNDKTQIKTVADGHHKPDENQNPDKNSRRRSS